MFVPVALISLISALAGGSPWAGSFSMQGASVNRFNKGRTRQPLRPSAS